ncbi:MAG: HNH endonuclease [Planctomycetales bacterium]|nr:HNH endonuclease [Planctomycetales bacterium]NIM09812.1 HNH endonuclease [Planctomycetales bacterium]NIN09281.1 HNH endonuclease [Planctomycetales bacterium]NIN78384.1 HNH endonuclease [Planctomycetales bacterium]NIO35562.1 HNH endonuclease [Planctomycetales bacterium]
MQSLARLDALSHSVLVLNRFYMAVHVVNLRRAIGLLFRDLAEVIHVESGQYVNYDFVSWREISELKQAFAELEPGADWLRSVNFRIQIPRVIRLLSYDKVPNRGLRFNRRNVFARDANRCQYCGATFPTSELSLDHVTPRSQGGQMSWENIVCCCVDCNARKGGRTPREAGMKLIRSPKRPKHNPLLSGKLNNPKYESWKTFLSNAYWSIDLK